MWLLVSSIAYLFNAISMAVNKSLLNKSIPNPVVYTFYITILGLLAFILAPFGLHWIGTNFLLISIVAGLCYTFALLTMFKALMYDEVSRVTPMIGSWQPVFVFLLAFVLIGERLAFNQIFGFALILLGGYLITKHWEKVRQNNYKLIVLALLSSLLFALSFVISKYLFDQVGFISGFIWTRIGSFIGALILLLWVKNRKAIFQNVGSTGQQTTFLFIGGQLAGGLYFILLNWSISIGSVTLINAMQGMQYVFLFFIVLLLSKNHPEWLKENTSKKILLQKIFSIVLIGIGLFIIT
ncbi:MAG: GRP family sugar transporter [Candidatus Komeilibacteria bacterium]